MLLQSSKKVQDRRTGASVDAMWLKKLHNYQLTEESMTYTIMVMARRGLTKLYQQMVDDGLIVPVEQAPHFTYPSMLTPVNSVTTYGVTDTRGLSGEQSAQLERNTQRDHR